MSLPRRDVPGLDVPTADRSVTVAAALESHLEAAAGAACRGAFVRLFTEAARAQATALDLLRAGGVPVGPLAGRVVSIKDLFDVAGAPTTGGSAVLAATAQPAAADAPAVARLRAAGAIPLGHTQCSEFAFSGVGINPHQGTPANPATAALDDAPRIPGGSTSGGAVSVAAGAAWAALGSDTGGSIRIPAALQGLVGFKSTQRLTPLQGCLPLSPSLDTVCAITRDVGAAIAVHEVLAARCVAPQARPLSACRFLVPTTVMLDGLDDPVADAFDRLLAALRAAGARLDERPLPPLAELAGLNAAGGLPAAESWAFHRTRMVHEGDRIDPRVAARIRRGASISAADLLDLFAARRDWIARVEAELAGYDAALAPTVPMVAPPIAPLLEEDAAFFDVNARLLRNPSAVNFLDGCALSLPCQPAGGWPVGLMVFAPALQDDRVLGIGRAIESRLRGES
jgi:aspartyl-tRNA(Asn)/glutamyl-tRNA(Gln) amidotransferase subunit A